MIVAVDQHGEDAGDGALAQPRAGAFEQLRQFGEHRRRIAFRGRRLAGRQPDLTLRHRKTCDRVHQAQHVLVVVAEVFGDRQRQIRRLPPHQRRLVRRRDHNHGTRETFLAEVVLQELLHLAAAFADQPDHRHRGIDVASEHRQQHGLTNAGTGEDTHALPAAAGEKGVECTHAEIERHADALARMRRRRLIAERHRRRTLYQWPLAVDRFAQSVNNAAEPMRRRSHLSGRVRDDRTAAAAHAFQSCERHDDGVVTGESDYFARDRSVGAGFDNDACANAHRVNWPGDLDHQTAHTDDASIGIDAIDVADLFRQGLHCETLKFIDAGPVALTSCLPASLIIASLSLVAEHACPSE